MWVFCISSWSHKYSPLLIGQIGLALCTFNLLGINKKLMLCIQQIWPAQSTMRFTVTYSYMLIIMLCATTLLVLMAMQLSSNRDQEEQKSISSKGIPFVCVLMNLDCMHWKCELLWHSQLQWYQPSHYSIKPRLNFTKTAATWWI